MYRKTIKYYFWNSVRTILISSTKLLDFYLILLEPILFDSKLEILLLCANENVQLFFANFKGIKRPSGGKLLGNIFVNRLKKKKKNTVLKGSVHGTMIQLKEGN